MRVLFVLLFCCLTGSAFAADEVVTFNDHIKPIFLNNCFSCHNADKAKAGLDLTRVAAILQGGSSGAVVEPGNPDGSRLYQVMTHTQQPFMPKDAPARPKEELDLVKRWIAGGLVERAGGQAIQAKPKADLQLASAPTERPAGPPPMPPVLPLEPVLRTAHTNVADVVAASPWAPLVALGAPKQVLLYQSDTRQFLGALPFNEGIPRTLKFSRNGKLLLCGGGRPGQMGRVVVWDITTAQRVIEVGEEFDTVLAADISADQTLIALGGRDKLVKVFSTATGERVQVQRKHTDWVTAMEYSPDGVLLATGDRNGGLVVWEARSGQEFYVLNGHQGQITDISWRKDSNVLASASEDGTVKLWNMQDGSQIRSWNAHGDGVLAVEFAKDGRLVTSGRDRLARVWDGNAGKLAEIKDFKDIVLSAVFTHDDQRLVIGDWTGEVRVTSTAKGESLGSVALNPPPISDRIEAAFAQIAVFEKELPVKDAAAMKAEVEAKQKTAELDATRKEFQEADKVVQGIEAENTGSAKAQEHAKAELDKATQELASLREKAKGLEDHWKAAEQERIKVEAAVRESQHKLAEQQKNKEAFDKAVEVAKADLTATPEDEGKKSALAAAETQIKQSLDALNALQQKVSDAKASLDSLIKSVADAKGAFDQATQAVAGADGVVAQKKKAFEDAGTALGQVATKLQQARSRRDELSNAVADKERIATETRQKAEAAAAEKADAERNLDFARSELNRLKAGTLDLLLDRVRHKLKESGRDAGELAAVMETTDKAIDKLKFPKTVSAVKKQVAPEPQPHPAWSFFGRFHIVLLHFPIAILLLVGMLEVAGWVRPSERAYQMTGLILRVGVISGLVTVICGLMLARGGHYEAADLSLHQWLGIAAAGCATIAVMVRGRQGPSPRGVYYPVLLGTIVCLTAAAHEGGSLTHGEGFLTRYMPDLMAQVTGQKPVKSALTPSARQFVATVKPILENRCYSCHGAEKQSGGLRLDVKTAALKGGKSGRPAVVAGLALESELVRRITAPRDADEVMPPEEKSALSPDEIVALIQWINTGAEWPESGATLAKEKPASPPPHPPATSPPAEKAS